MPITIHQSFAFACLVAIPHILYAQQSVTFDRDVMAVLSKAGCNSGACHGNLNGKGGFRLSLRGQNAWDDYLAVTHDLGSRRINRVSPRESLVLLKPTSGVPHEGGQRFEEGSLEHQIISSWIEAGTPGPDSSLPQLESIQVSPKDITIEDPKNATQLKVVATFADGTNRDVTLLATYETTNYVASVSSMGKIERKSYGESQVIVRYLSLQQPVRIAFLPDTPFRWSQPIEKNAIDHRIFAKLKTLKINPENVGSNHTFLRRVYLDLLGILPTADEAREFINDRRPNNRMRLVDRVLARPEFADHWAQKWCDLLRVEERLLDENGTRIFHSWIRDCFAQGRPLNEFAAEILSAEGSTYKEPPTNFYRAVRDPFSRGETVARVFLGFRLQCAKCHNHPFDQWTQDDYYSWAACFAKVDYEIIENKRPDKLDNSLFVGEQIVKRDEKKQVKNVRTGNDAIAKFLDARRTSIKAKDSQERFADPLDQLASWFADDNRQFAAAQVNRIWYHLMGRGLVEPIDDFRITNPASHPMLLHELTDDFIASNFDVRRTIRQILNSQTYQLATSDDEPTPLAEVNYAANRVRRLTAEQLLDAQCLVLDVAPEFDGYDVGIRAGQLPGIKKQFRGRATRDDRFLEKFGKPARNMSCECERSDEPNLSQVFMLLSDEMSEQRLSDESNRIFQLSRSMASPTQVVTDLYWSALSRPPTDQELKHAHGLFATTTETVDVLQDLAWALMNSKEFIFRH